MLNNVPDIVQSLWIGPKLSAMEKLCIESFLHHGHPFHLYVYDHVEGVPGQAKLCDANAIVPSSRIFFYSKHNSCAGFANMFRYKLLLERGGWWVDTDTICLDPFRFSGPYIFSSEKSNDRAGHCVNAGIMRTPANTDLMRYCWEYCDQADNSALKWGDTGPKLIARALEKYSLSQFVQPPHVFCPVPFQEWDHVLAPGVKWQFHGGTRAIHLWNEMWRRNNCPKDAAYDPVCLYEQLKSRYLDNREKLAQDRSASGRGGCLSPRSGRHSLCT